MPRSTIARRVLSRASAWSSVGCVTASESKREAIEVAAQITHKAAQLAADIGFLLAEPINFRLLFRRQFGA